MSRIDRMSPEDLAWLQARVIERDGCWVWIGAIQDGVPRAGKDNKSIAVRRWVYNATRQQPIRRHECAVTDCDTYGCVHPDCVIKASRSSRQKGRKQSADHTLAITKAMRARSRLSQADVAAIRASDEPHHVIAQRYGIDHSHVCAIRLGRVRVDYSHPFAGLLAANGDIARRA